jgi:hypothetical protein
MHLEVTPDHDNNGRFVALSNIGLVTTTHDSILCSQLFVALPLEQVVYLLCLNFT